MNQSLLQLSQNVRKFFMEYLVVPLHDIIQNLFARQGRGFNDLTVLIQLDSCYTPKFIEGNLIILHHPITMSLLQLDEKILKNIPMDKIKGFTIAYLLCSLQTTKNQLSQDTSRAKGHHIVESENLLLIFQKAESAM